MRTAPPTALARHPPTHLAAARGDWSRREFLSNAAKAAAVGLAAPTLLTRRASAGTDSLHRFLLRALAEADTPGIAVAVVRGDEIVYSAGVGWADTEAGIPVTPQTAFQLASISKTVTCAGIMALVEEGRLDLDADINDSLPFEVHIPAAPKVPITMRQLLTHTSAIRDRANVWGTPWTKHTLYFHGDSPISLERLPISRMTAADCSIEARTRPIP